MEHYSVESNLIDAKKGKSMGTTQFLSEEYPSAGSFKQLLAQFPEDVLAKRYLLTGVPHIFKDHPLQYISFCETVSRNLDLGSHDVAVIGSTRIGYSLAPDKFGTPVKPGSDVDTVIVSEHLFKQGAFEVLRWLANCGPDVPYGDEAKDAEENIELDTDEWGRLKSAARNICNGYIAPNLLPDDSDYKQRIFGATNEVATQLLAMKPPGPVWKVRCRIFRSWKEAESHYASSLRHLKRDLGVGGGHNHILDEVPEVESGASKK